MGKTLARGGRQVCNPGDILAAASRLYLKWGYRKTTVEDIADEAGICRATVYVHFRGKDEIALAWVERYLAARRAALGAIAAESGPAAERLCRMLVERVMFSVDAATPYADSIDELFSALRARLMARRDAARVLEAGIFAQTLREGVAMGEFCLADPDDAARAVVAATNSLLPDTLSPHVLGERSEIEATIRSVATILVRGMMRAQATSLRCTCPSTPNRPPLEDIP